MNRYPYLVPGAGWIAEEDGRFLLTLPERAAALRMGRLEQRIVAALDGLTPPSEVARNLALALGKPISEASMNAVLRRLGEQGFLVFPPRPQVQVLPGARLACCRSGHCCHLGVGPLSALEQRRLSSLPWEAQGEQPPGEPIFREQDGAVFLCQRAEDAACTFLEQDGLCRVHRVFGPEAKPAICRLFPLFTVDIGGGLLRAGTCFECPGAALADPADSLAAELVRAGELVLATQLEAGPPMLLAAEQLEEGGAVEEIGLELEQEMLALLSRWGSSAGQALGECSRRLLAAAAEVLPEGASCTDWVAALAGLASELLERTASPYYRERLAALAGLLERFLRERPPGSADGGERPPAPPPAELDGLLRRAWANYVFTRHHLFRFGQIGGLALLMLAHLLFLQQLREDAAIAVGRRSGAGQAGQAEQARAGELLSRTMTLLRVLEPVDSFPEVGGRVLQELGRRLALAEGHEEPRR